MTTEEQPVPTLPVVKKRYEWIDNARVVAAFLILFNHLMSMTQFGGTYGSEYVRMLVLGVPYYGRVPFFLVLAGYFLSRNITWSKAFDRFLWLLIPFAAWNCIYAFGCLGKPFTPEIFCTYVMGINKVFIFDIPFFSDISQCEPAIGPSWFLRDIMFLSLLTPIIVRFTKWIPMMLLFMVSIVLLNSAPHPSYFLSPQTVFFYLVGVWLVRFKIDDAYRIFNPGFTKYFVWGIVFSTCCITYLCSRPLPDVTYLAKVPLYVIMLHGFFCTLPGMLFGTLLIGYSGVLIERYLPRFSKALVPCGPACFLVFMLHWPILTFMKAWVPAEIWNSWWILCLPIPLFAVICMFFLGMKKYTPFLMPYLGHMKMPKKKAPAKSAG